jgi:hypothetical protein
MVSKKRKPAIESRVGHSVGSKPKSPIDDFAKWVISHGGKVSQSEVKTMKRYARGIGWSGDFEKKGLDTLAEGVRGGSTRARLARHKLDMYYKKQDKYARLYGDSRGPNERFFSGMDKGISPRREFNRRANTAWNAEVEIGRKQGRRTSTKTKGYLSKKKAR